MIIPKHITNLVVEKAFLKKFQLLLVMIAGIFCVFSVQISLSQDNVGIGTTTPDPSALLELNNGLGVPKGLLIPRVTTVQRDAITLPAPALLIYNTTNTRFEYNAGTAAVPLWSANFTGLSGMPWSLTGNAGTTSANFLGTTDGQDLIFKTNSIERARFTSGGNMLLKSGATAAEFQFFEPSGAGTNYTAFKAGAQAADITYILPLAQGAAGTVLRNDGSGNLSWATDATGVTSVGLSMPSIFTVSNSPVTSTGTLTAVFNMQTANTIFAGPSTGVAAEPTFRSLVAADIPNLDASKITSGILPIARGGTNSGTALNNNRVLISSGGSIVEAPAGTAGQILTSNGAAAPSWQAAGAVSFGTLTGGTNTTAAMIVGTGATLSPTGTGTITANQYTGSGSTTTAVDLATAEVAGLLPIARGGTNATATPTAGAIAYGTGTAYGFTSAGTAGQLLVSNGSGVPSWSNTNSIAWSLTGNSGTSPLTNFLGTTDAQDVVFKTNNIERLRLASGGNMLLKSGATAAEFQFFEPSGAGTNYTAFKARAQAADITYTLPPTQGASGSILSNDGLGNLTWAADATGVTSVGLSMPSIFTVTNSPVTSTGTLTASLNTQPANIIFAGPAWGLPAVPSFRSLVAGDIPDLDASKITSGILPVSLGGTSVSTITGILVGNGTSPFVGRTLTGTTSQISITNGNGTAGNPTVAIASDPVIPGTGSLTSPSGTTAQRPSSPANGMMRYNTTLNKFEYYENGAWISNNLSGSGTANYVTKFTGSTALGNSTIYDDGTNVGVNTASPNTAALLDLTSTAKGFLPPRMTGAQKNAIAPPASAAGLMVYQTNVVGMEQIGPYVWDGTSWGRLLINSVPIVSVITKSTDQARTSYGDDADLQFPLLANEKWAIEGLIIVRNNSSQGGITFGFEAPTGATFQSGYHSNQDNASGFIGGILLTNNQTASFKVNTSGEYLVVFVKAVVTCGSTPGNFKLRWNSFNSGTSTVKAGSYFTGARAL